MRWLQKGRIISQKGEASPQIDILVLKNHYPKKLLNKKLYLAAGVAAVFECKTTLKSSHIEEAVRTCANLKSFYQPRFGTPYKELRSPIIYGLLAHSHFWKGNQSTPEENIKKKLIESDCTHVYHPRMQIDILCVSDLAAWTLSNMTFIGPSTIPDWSEMVPFYGPNGSAISVHMGHTRKHEKQAEQFARGSTNFLPYSEACLGKSRAS